MVKELDAFSTSQGDKITLEDRITILGYFGKDLESNHANAYNLAHKIYKKNFQFKDFQFVMIMPEGTEKKVEELNKTLSDIADTGNWYFVYGSTEDIKEQFSSLETNYTLDENISTPYVFIIDKERNLRGRDKDDTEIQFGFDARDYSEINNAMGDDVKVILAEYRLALKKYNSNREI